jgi:hypothetical protein
MKRWSLLILFYFSFDVPLGEVLLQYSYIPYKVHYIFIVYNPAHHGELKKPSSHIRKREQKNKRMKKG